MQCPNCKATVSDNANFCRYCSAKLRKVCDCWIKKEPYNCGHCTYPRCKDRKPGQQGCEHFQQIKPKGK